jgi:hypothetical protein
VCSTTCWHRTRVSAPVLGNGLSISTFVNVAPIDDQTTVNRFAVVRSLQTPFAKELANRALNLEIWDRIVYDAMMA